MSRPQYRKLEKLGAGSSSVVFRAVLLNRKGLKGRPVALKVSKKKNEKARNRCYTKGFIHSILKQHPNIVGFRQTLIDDSSLREMLKERKRLDEDKTREFTIQITSGIVSRITTIHG